MEEELALSWMGTVVAMIAGGAIGVFLAPLVRPAIARNARPTLKAAIHAGVLVYQQGREAIAELSEVIEDVAAEVRAEQNGSRFEEQNIRATPPAPLIHGRR
jgi:hypothetical protein